MKHWLTVISVVLPLWLSAQIISNYDSVPVGKPKAMKSLYQLDHPQLREIKLVNNNPRSETKMPKKFWSGEGAFTLLTGLQTSDSEAMIWIMDNALSITSAEYSWQVPLYCPGEYSKNRERVKNEDGSRSVETNETISLDWDMGSSGLIVEQRDTLGAFIVIKNPIEDSLSKVWLSTLLKNGSKLIQRLKRYDGGFPKNSFLVRGELNGRYFSMVTSGNHYQTVLIVDGIPVAFYQREPDFIILGKKDKLYPYILIAKDERDRDRMDIIRLALLNTLVIQSTQTSLYTK